MKFIVYVLTFALWLGGFYLLELTRHSSYCVGETRELRREGTWKCYDSQDRLASQINYVQGKKQGSVYLYYPNGGIDTFSQWKKGQLEGDFESYARGGQLLLKAHYVEGRFEGYLSEWNEDGDLLYRCRYQSGIPDKSCGITKDQ